MCFDLQNKLYFWIQAKKLILDRPFLVFLISLYIRLKNLKMAKTTLKRPLINFFCLTQLPVVLLPGGRPPQQLFVLLVLLSNFFLSSSQVICPPQKKFVNS